MEDEYKTQKTTRGNTFYKVKKKLSNSFNELYQYDTIQYNYKDPLKTNRTGVKNSFGNFDYINSLNDLDESTISQNDRDELIKSNPLVFSLNSNNPFKSHNINKDKYEDYKLKQVTKLAFPGPKDHSEKDLARKRAIKMFLGMNSMRNDLDKLKYLGVSNLIPEDKKKGKINN